jgi:hypothetical protein
MGEEVKQVIPRFKMDLLSNLDKITHFINKEYLNNLKDYYDVYNFDDYNKTNEEKQKINEDNIRILKIEQWVKDKAERTSDNFKNIINAFEKSDITLSLIIKRRKNETTFYLSVKNETKKGEDIKSRTELANGLLKDSIKGNFPGSIVSEGDNTKIIVEEKIKSISSVTNIVSEKSEKYISQGIEKLIDGIIPSEETDEYTIVIIAEPLNTNQIRTIKNGFEELATFLYPYTSYQFSKNVQVADTESENKSSSFSKSTNKSISKTAGISIPIGGIKVKYKDVSAELPPINISFSKTKVEGTSENYTSVFGIATSRTQGSGEGEAYNHKSYIIAGIINKLETQIKRIELGEAIGLWKCASYVLAENGKTSFKVANYLKSLSVGNESFVEPSYVNEWSDNEDGKSSEFNSIKKYVCNFTHPIFLNKYDLDNANKEPNGDIAKVTLTSYINTSELSEQFAFPNKSIKGLPLLECASFGREAIMYKTDKIKNEDANIKKLTIGKIYHMHNLEESIVELYIKNLTSHTFITGSTGSGKSNTIYKILDELKTTTPPTKFLVIEPARGEYKNVFGNEKDVKVYGTNPYMSPLIKINPFSFPDKIHILEHLDRLVEIFNVCWPMYAAMPAILKKAIEKSYEDAGWNLKKSKNKYEKIFAKKLYPAFKDIVFNIRNIVDSSEYNDENKGMYKGALITRLEELTTGINGLIFCNDELSEEQLFESNVIIDIGRIGSETKSLIMGLLVMKLNEYYINKHSGMNHDLRHVTVLEEAHNLLKRTSTEQSFESANIVGKSVEMLANAIAEMRTYGEGFIIADQSPGLLDISVIRNTNTKIILRLLEKGDRDLVGKASNLNNDQIDELSKLPCGVAAIYQNEWVQPVLCKVNDFFIDSDGKEKDKIDYKPNYSDLPVLEDDTDDLLKRKIVFYLFSKMIKNSHEQSIDVLRSELINSNIENRIKIKVLEYLDLKQIPDKITSKLSSIVAGLYQCPDRKIIDEAPRNINSFIDSVRPTLATYKKHQNLRDYILSCIVENTKARRT